MDNKGFFEVHMDVDDEVDYASPRFLADVAQALVGAMAQFGMKVAVDVTFTQMACAWNNDEEETESED